MGNYMHMFKRRTDARILCIGPDAAGKTTMLCRLKHGKVATTKPTLGVNAETIEHNNVNLTFWDVGQIEAWPHLIRQLTSGIGAVVCVVDCTDSRRLDEALTDRLHYILVDDKMAGIPVLVLVNKQDIAAAMAVAEVTDAVEKSGMLRGHPWKVIGTVAITGDGLCESLDWLTAAVTQDVT